MSDPVLDSYNDFAAAIIEWAAFVAHLSPYSPDYQTEVAEKWYTLRIGELFRRLEQFVTRRP